MYSAENRIIEVGNSICNKKYNIIAIFQFAKKYRDQLVASDIRLRALFQIYICFVQKNKNISVIDNLKDAQKLNFYRR